MNKHAEKTICLVYLLAVLFSGCGCLGFGTTDVYLYPAKKMNADDLGQPLPTVVWVYQLKSKDRMEQADFKAIWKNDKGALADDLLEKKEITIYPKEIQRVKLDEKEGVKYIAVVAIFRKPDEEANTWRKIIEVRSLTLGSQDIDLTVEQNVLKVGILKLEE